MRGSLSMDASPKWNPEDSQNPKIGGFREVFLPENGFKFCFTVNFPKKTSRFWKLEKEPKT